MLQSVISSRTPLVPNDWSCSQAVAVRQTPALLSTPPLTNTGSTHLMRRRCAAGWRALPSDQFGRSNSTPWRATAQAGIQDRGKVPASVIDPTKITRLRIKDPQNLNKLCEQLAEWIKQGQLSKLKSLDLGLTSHGAAPDAIVAVNAEDAGDGVEALLESLIAAPQPVPLEALSFSGHRLSQATVNKFLQFLATPAADWLQALDLSDCNLSDIDIARLSWNLTAQSHNPVPLRELNLAFNHLTSVAGTALAEAFVSGALNQLSRLDLRCKLSRIPDDSTGPYETLLKRLTNSNSKNSLGLQELYLEGAVISDDELHNLIKARQEGPLARLQAVWVANSCISEQSRGWLSGEPCIHVFAESSLSAK